MGSSASAPEILTEAIRQFNQWRFYDCHETLEDIWRESGGKAPGAPAAAGFYQGLIKLAAGFHHLLRGNHAGAVSLLGSGIDLLAPHRPSCQGIDVQRLVQEAGACLARVRELGPQRPTELDRALIPRIHLASRGPATVGPAAEFAQGDTDGGG